MTNAQLALSLAVKTIKDLKYSSVDDILDVADSLLRWLNTKDEECQSTDKVSKTLNV